MIRDLDNKIFWLINNHHNNLADFIFYWISRFGELGFIWILVLLGVLLFDKKNGRKNALLIGLSLVFAFVVNDLILKSLIFRIRPYLFFQGVHQLGIAWKNSSFPSGHAATSVAAGIGLIFCYKKWIVPTTLFVLVMCYSRVYLGMHYPTDVLAGTLVGILSFLLAIKILKRR